MNTYLLLKKVSKNERVGIPFDAFLCLQDVAAKATTKMVVAVSFMALATTYAGAASSTPVLNIAFRKEVEGGSQEAG